MPLEDGYKDSEKIVLNVLPQVEQLSLNPGSNVIFQRLVIYLTNILVCIFFSVCVMSGVTLKPHEGLGGFLQTLQWKYASL